MASDLSTLIQDGFCSTLNGLLAKEATIKQTNKAVEQDFQNKQHLMVESTFEFDNITSTWKFFIPAYTSSLIFNTMLGDESEPVTEIDADIADAISEFISNLSGGLTTAINGAAFEDLGQSKFTIGSNEILDEIDDIADTYKFSIDLDGNDIELYTKYDEIILPFLTAILSSPESVYASEEPAIEEEPEEEQLVPVEEEELEEVPAAPEDSQLTAKEAAFQDQEVEKESSEQNTAPEKKTEQETNKDIPEEEEQGEPTEEDKKAKKLKIIIIAVGALLVLTIISGIVMYFMGAFDPEPVPVKDNNTTKMVKKVGDVEVVQYKSTKKSDFNPEMIDTARLNARLEALSKYEVLSDQEIAEQEAEQKERDYRLKKEQELMAFAAKNKEENIFIEEKNTSKEHKKEKESTSITSSLEKIEMVKEEPKVVKTIKEVSKKEEMPLIQKDDKLKFVLVESLKYKLYKNLISQVNTHQARISICKNSDGRTSVYIGPFNDKAMQSKMLELLQNKNVIDAKKINLNKEEFDSRCNFE